MVRQCHKTNNLLLLNDSSFFHNRASWAETVSTEGVVQLQGDQLHQVGCPAGVRILRRTEVEVYTNLQITNQCEYRRE